MRNVKKVVVIMVVVLAVTGGAFAAAPAVSVPTAPYTPDSYTAMLFHFDTLVDNNPGDGQKLINDTAYEYPQGTPSGTWGGWRGVWDSGAAADDPDLVGGYFGNALDFEKDEFDFVGSKPYAGVRQGMQEGFSLEAFINLEAISSDYHQVIISRGGALQFKVQKATGKLECFVKSNTVGANFVYTQTVATLPAEIGNWVHVAFSMDGALASSPGTIATAGQLYIDGAAVGTTFQVGGAGIPLGIGDTPDYPGIGGFYAGPDAGRHSFDGLMDEVRIQTIPEPATMILLGLGGLIAARRRKA